MLKGRRGMQSTGSQQAQDIFGNKNQFEYIRNRNQTSVTDCLGQIGSV